MTDLDMARRYRPRVHMDRAETIPLRAVGYTVFHETGASRSFPKRQILVSQGAVVEYAFFWNYDVEHMYDLEHIWVYVAPDGEIQGAEGSYHGKYLNLLVPGFPGTLAPDGDHVQAFCQPGKHAMLASGEMTRLYPGWDRCCREPGGPVLIGNPFCAAYAPSGQDLFVPSEADNARSKRYLREQLAFEPTLDFSESIVPTALLLSWDALYEKIPGWIAQECRRLEAFYAQ